MRTEKRTRTRRQRIIFVCKCDKEQVFGLISKKGGKYEKTDIARV